MADVGANSFTPINMWAMLRQLINNNVPILTIAGAPTDGTSGSFAGQAGPGALLIDYTNGKIYQNTNTSASPVWASVVAGGSLTGLGGVGYAKSLYDFSVDGGAVSAILPVKGAILPAKAIVLGGVLDIVTTFTSGGLATLALGTSAGSSATSILAATAVASLTAGVSTVLVPKFTAATIFKMTAAGSLQWTIETAAMTAGKAGLTLVYLVGD